MSFSNANYLSNPNRLSTKVHYAPGGASSLSLAWDDTPNPRSNPPKYPQSNYQKQQTEPGQNYAYNQQQWDQKNSRNHESTLLPSPGSRSKQSFGSGVAVLPESQQGAADKHPQW